MEIRGERECASCGTRWSYYETGSVECPACGSLRSVGVDGRTEHTAGAEDLDLTDLRNAADGTPLREVAREAKPALRRFVHRSGFVDAGELRPLSDVDLAARELLHVADLVARGLALAEDEEYYFLSLLRDADQGERPVPEAVPASLREARGLAYTEAVRDYRRELLDWADADPALRGATERLGDHVTRIRALEGDVSPKEVERLVAATRDVAAYAREDDEGALATATDRLDRLSAGSG